MSSGDPALIICLRSGSDGRAISANDSNLISGVDLLGATGRLLGAFTTLTTALLLGEESGNPGVINEVHGSAEHAEEDEVQEDARSC